MPEPQKASAPIIRKDEPSSKTTFFKLLLSPKHLSEIAFTLAGMHIDLKEVLQKTFFPKASILLGPSKLISTNDGQAEKHASPMISIEEGIVTLTKPEPEKAILPNSLMREFGAKFINDNPVLQQKHPSEIRST
jgi:hypothetical protein